jgi:hypothetical protein
LRACASASSASHWRSATRSAPCSPKRCVCSRRSAGRLCVIETGVAEGVSGTAFLALSHDVRVRSVKKMSKKTLTMLRAPHARLLPRSRGVRRSRVARLQKTRGARGRGSPHGALNSSVTFAQRAEPSLCARMRRLELTRMFRLAPELGTQHRPACLFCFVPRDIGLYGNLRVECGLQT